MERVESGIAIGGADRGSSLELRVHRAYEYEYRGERIGPRIFNSGPYFGTTRAGWNREFTAEDIYREVDYWAEQGDGKKAARYLYYTMGGALTFVVVKSFEWADEIAHGFTITANTFWSFYYLAAGLHALHVIGGVIIMGIISRDAAKGLELHRVELIGLYWHFVDLVWIFLFPLLYIAK